MGWGEAGGPAQAWPEGHGLPRAVGRRPVCSPRGTVMALGRAEKFLSWDEGKGMGREGGAPFASKSNCNSPPCWPNIWRDVCQTPQINPSGFHYGLLSRDSAHDTGRAPAGLLPGRHMKPLAFSTSLLCLRSWAPNLEMLAETGEGAFFG